MTPFHFRLERVLRWRRIELTAAEARLKALMAEEGRLRESIAAVDKEKLNIAREVGALPHLSGADLSSASAYARHLVQDRVKLVQRLNAKQNEVAAQLIAHRSAKQKHELLSELKSRRLAEWELQSAREIEATAQESFLARWDRQTSSS